MAKGQKSYTLEDYNKSMELLNMGMGPTEASRILDIPRCTVEDWKYRGEDTMAS